MNRLNTPFSFEFFADEMCKNCTEDWYCPTYCKLLSKAKEIPFNLITRSYIRNDGDLVKVARFIKRKRL